jgi:hypothetical protein
MRLPPLSLSLERIPMITLLSDLLIIGGVLFIFMLLVGVVCVMIDQVLYDR